MSRSRNRKSPRAPGGRPAANRSSQRPTERKSAAGAMGLTLVAICFVIGVGGGLLLRQRDPIVDEASPNDTSNASSIAGRAAISDDGDGDDGANRVSAQQQSTTAKPDAPVPLSPAAAQEAPTDPAKRRALESQFGALFRSGHKHYHAERYSQAAADFQAAVQVAPYLAEGHFYLGETYRKLTFNGPAEQCYRAALQRLPDFREAREALCILLYERGAYEEAVKRLETQLEQDPNDNFSLGELAINRLALGDAAQAVDMLEQYNARVGPQAWGYVQLGRAHEMQGDLVKAEQFYRDALQLDPFKDIAYYWLGLLLARQERDKESREAMSQFDQLRELRNTEHDLQMALLRDANNPETLLKLAQVRYALGAKQQALKTLQQAQRLAPNHPLVRQLRANWN